MDTLKTYLDKVKDHITETLACENTLAQLSLTDLDEFLKTKFLLETTQWDEQKKISKEIKERYLDLQKTDIDKLKAILHWKDAGNWMNKIDVNAYKPQVIESVNNALAAEVDTPCSKYDTIEAYDMLWDLVKSNTIKLTPQEIDQLDIRFIEYIMSRSQYSNPFRITLKDENYTDDEECNPKAHMNPMERFWINLIASGRMDIKDTDAVLLCLGLDVDPRLRYMPQKVTIFEDGDLLSQITAHYDNAALSPMIKCRRNLGIIIENCNYNFHDYREYIKANGGSFSTNMFAIEMPYMCYIYVDRIEVDGLSYYGSESKKTNGYVDVGDEYIMNSFRPVNQQKDQMITLIPPELKTFTKKCKENTRPGYYTTISFGYSGYVTVYAVRVYGKAISLV